MLTKTERIEFNQVLIDNKSVCEWLNENIVWVLIIFILICTIIVVRKPNDKN